jgi:hypothetical protein
MFKFFIYLFKCLLNSQKADYKISISKDGKKQIHTHTKTKEYKRSIIIIIMNFDDNMPQ